MKKTNINCMFALISASMLLYSINVSATTVLYKSFNNLVDESDFVITGNIK